MDREKVIGELEEHIESTLAVHDVYADGIPLDLLQYTVALLKEQDEEIAFLKAMQLQTVHNMSNEDIGNAVRNVLRL